MQRRHFILGTLATPVAARAALAQGGRPELTVWKSPTCGCCGAWVAHMREAGFAVTAQDVDQDTLDRIKAQRGVAPEFGSCHTGEVAGYVIEGHVPAEDVRRLVERRPDALGLSVPAMPVGSPGMEMGDRADPFVTLLLGRDGGAEVFARHNGA